MSQSVDQYLNNGSGNYSPEPTQTPPAHYAQQQSNGYPQTTYYPPPQQQQRIQPQRMQRNNDALFSLLSTVLLVLIALGGTALVAFNMGAYMIKIQYGITNTR